MFALTIACLLAITTSVTSQRFTFPDEQKKREPITPPVLPVLEHLERDPSTLLPSETGTKISPKFGFGGGFNVRPSNGGLSASVSQSASGGGASQSASQSFAFGFNQGFSASQSASQAASFNGFGGGLSGSQASSQAASFGGLSNSLSGSASASSAFAGNGGSQSASQAFGFNSNRFPRPQASFGDGLLDIRHRGGPDFPFPDFPDFIGRGRGVGAAAFKSSYPSEIDDNDFYAVLVSN